MFSISLNFPYEHQINKIYPTVLPNFLGRVELLAKENGCKRVLKEDAGIYLFNTEKIASVFFISRFLYLLVDLLLQVSSRIHEYRILVDVFPDNYKDNEIVELSLQFKNRISKYNKIVVSSKADKYLKKYLCLSKNKKTSFSVCNDFNFFRNIRTSKLGEYKKLAPQIFIRAGQNYLVALYNFFLMHPLYEDDVDIFAENKKIYYETRSVLTFFAKNRFKEEFPKYFIDAFIIYAKLHIKMYKTLYKMREIEICLCSEDAELAGEVEKLRQVVGEHKIICFKNVNFGLDDIPEDLLELIYLLLRCIQFVFFDEIRSLFFFITKSNAYEEILTFMFHYGIILKKGEIYAYNSVALVAIEKKLKTKKSKLDMCVANFLLNEYENSNLGADVGLKYVLDMLKSEYSERFMIDIFFNPQKKFSIFYCGEISKTDFSNILILEKYENAYNLQNEGNFSLALSIVKDLNSSFHSYVLSGEYKNLLLLALLYLKNNNISDSLTYYVYALEIAKKTRNDYFICESLFFLGVVYFLQKDFQNAFVVLQELGKCISTYFRQEWKVFYLFMQGRIYLELGQANVATSFFKMARDFAHLYFSEFHSFCSSWYARSCIYEGKLESGKTLLNKNISAESLLFLLEASILFPSEFDESEVLFLKKKYEIQAKDDVNILTGFSFIEDVTWTKTYGMSYTDRMFSQFYSYYIVSLSKEDIKEKAMHLEKLIPLALDSLYAKDISASLYLYLCYEAQLKIDAESVGVALGFLSKACRVMQQASMLMYDVGMRDKFMKQNIWNSKLFKVSSENKLI